MLPLQLPKDFSLMTLTNFLLLWNESALLGGRGVDFVGKLLNPVDQKLLRSLKNSSV
ncbi:MAG: hypothetical protein V7L22_20530 [Nostoc sp.]|uniref:hypothetical protein n=1 Tax=Nostoc sp. TaxID=1180 RepID=UPI002FF62705